MEKTNVDDINYKKGFNIDSKKETRRTDKKLKEVLDKTKNKPLIDLNEKNTMNGFIKSKEFIYGGILFLLTIMMLTMVNFNQYNKMNLKMNSFILNTKSYVQNEIAKKNLNDEIIKEDFINVKKDINEIKNVTDYIQFQIDDQNYKKIDELMNNTKYREYIEKLMINSM